MSTRPWAGVPRRKRARASSRAIQPPMEEPTMSWGPVGGGQHRLGLLEPAADGAIVKTAAGGAVAGIIEAGDGKTLGGAQRIEPQGLAALHVGAETAEPEQARRSAGALLDRDVAGRRAGADGKAEAAGWRDRGGRHGQDFPIEWREPLSWRRGSWRIDGSKGQKFWRFAC